MPSPSIDGEAASPTTPSTPRASHRATRTSSLLSSGAHETADLSEEQQAHAPLPEMLVRAMNAVLIVDVETEEPPSEELARAVQSEGPEPETHEGDGVGGVESHIQDTDV